MVSINDLKYYFIVISLYLFVFGTAVAGVWDEMIAVLILAYGICNVIYRERIKVKTCKLLAPLLILVVTGLYSSFTLDFQSSTAIWSDLLVFIKFFLVSIWGIYFFDTFLFGRYQKRFQRHIRFITVALGSMVVFDEIFHVFEADQSGMFRHEQLFYSHATYLVAVSVFLLACITMQQTLRRIDKICILINILIIVSTFKIKAIALVIVYLIFYYIIIVRQKQFKVFYVLFFLPIILVVAWERIQFFFLSGSMETARAALLTGSLAIAKDYFPLGTGFATFGSFYSGVYYSPVYANYGLNNVYGLNKSFTAFISDSFWPMIIGQFGILGLICVVYILWKLFKSIQAIYVINKNKYLSAMTLFAYLLVASTSESAYVNSYAVTYALVIALIIYSKKDISNL